MLTAHVTEIGVMCEQTAYHYINLDSATQSDLLNSNIELVQALVMLKEMAAAFPRPIRQAVLRRLAKARANLAFKRYAVGSQLVAFKAASILLRRQPSVKNLRLLVSLLR